MMSSMSDRKIYKAGRKGREGASGGRLVSHLPVCMSHRRRGQFLLSVLFHTINDLHFDNRTHLLLGKGDFPLNAVMCTQ